MTLYDEDTKEFHEITPAVCVELIKQGIVRGVLYKNKSFILDKEFNQKNMILKSGVGRYRQLINGIAGIVPNPIYTVVKVINVNNKESFYEIVSSKCKRVEVTEEELRELSKSCLVAGCFITKEAVRVCDGIRVEERTT